MRQTLAVVLVCAGIACTSKTLLRRPLDAPTMRDLNADLLDRDAQIGIALEPAAAAALRDSLLQSRRAQCLAAPNNGGRRFAELCTNAAECECGLICQAGQCLGTSLADARPIELPPAKVVEATAIRLDPDVSTWREIGAADPRRRSVPTAALQQVSYRSHARGALDGFLLGWAIGGIGGGAWVAGRPNCVFLACTGTLGAEGFAAGFVVFGLVSGLVLGMPIGAAIGHRYVVEFRDTAAGE